MRVDKRKNNITENHLQEYLYAHLNNKNEINSVHAKLNKFILIPNEIVTTAWIAAYSLSYPLLNHTCHKFHPSDPAQCYCTNVASNNI